MAKEKTPTRKPENVEKSLVDPPINRRRFDPRIALLTSLGALIIVLVFAVVLSFFSKGSSSKTTGVNPSTLQLKADNSTFTATTLPDAGLLSMAGNVTTLSDAVNRTPTMINLFSSSCTACRTEMPDLEKLHHQANGKMQIVGVDLGDDSSTTKQFVKQMGVTYPVLRDPTSLLVDRLNINAQPMTLWVNAKGTIVAHRYGALTPTEMRLAAQQHFGIAIPKA